MKVLVMHGSKRKHGNTGLLAGEFIRGAEEVGHQVERVELGDMNFGDCLGCMACWKNPSLPILPTKSERISKKT